MDDEQDITALLTDDERAEFERAESKLRRLGPDDSRVLMRLIQEQVDGLDEIEQVKTATEIVNELLPGGDDAA